ncbi:MAG: hypothetical protein E6K53_15550, partial [Gammaproteobacteria bacterium]
MLTIFIAISAHGSSAENGADLVVSGKVIRMFGRCSVNDCHTMKYLIETTHIERKSKSITDAAIAVISACGDYNLKLGGSYRFELKEKNLSFNINDENPESDPNETYT